MTTMRWNAGALTALSLLLSITFASLASAAGDGARGTEAVSIHAAAGDVAPATRSATIHRINRSVDVANCLDIAVEDIRGIAIADGAMPGTVEIILTECRVPAALAQARTAPSPLVKSVTFEESTWGHESEAQITVAVADGVVADIQEGQGKVSVVFHTSDPANAPYTLRFIKTPYASHTPASIAALRSTLQELAGRPVADDTRAWFTAEKIASADRPVRKNTVTAAGLVAVRDAEFKLVSTGDLLFAAQDESVPVAEPAEETEVIEEAEEGEAVDEGEMAESPAVEEAETAPEPPVKRGPQAVNSAEANKALTRQQAIAAANAQPLEPPVAVEKKTWTGDPLKQPVTINFRDMELVNAVQILADMAGINVIAGTDLVGTVTLNLHNVPLMQAMETALRINGLGIVEEEGIYHIKPYLDAIASQRSTEVVEIENANAAEIATTLESVIQGSEYQSLISLSSNETANTVIIAGPEEQIRPLITMARRLDVEQAVLPTVTLPIKLNYAEPDAMLAAIEGMATPDVGKVSIDTRARMLIVTDIPIIVEKMAELVNQLDIPVKQVSIDAMIVDITLTDAADTGVDWIISAVQSQSRRDAAAGNNVFTGNLQELSLTSDLSIGDAAGLLDFGILSGDIDWRGVIQAEVRNNNSTLLSNPKLITVENQTATITIASEIPYVELVSTEEGGQQTNTEFKPIGTRLEVTPKVTHDDHIIAEITAKESTSSQFVNGIPVEDLREISTTPHIASGQTIYVGGLRKNNDTVSVRKVPVLGDVPIVNFLFRSNQRNETVNELLIFLTCSVIENHPQLTDYQREQANLVRGAEVEVSAETRVIYDTVHPSEFRDPAWKWRKHANSEVTVEASDPNE